MKHYVSIDIGGTAIKYGMISESGDILYSRQMETEAYLGGRQVLKKVLSIVENIRRTEPVSGVCISTAGMVDTRAGKVIHSADLIPDYAGICYKKAIQDRYGLPCQVENDVNCAGLAETVSGAACGSFSVLMLTIGTGIGGCFILDGKVYHGVGNSACEIGYMHMQGSDFQTLGAASVLSKKAAMRKHMKPEEWNGHKVFQAAKDGDRVCVQAIDEMVDILGMGIANICYVLNPQTVVLGGGIMAQKEYLKERIEAAVARYLIPAAAKHTSVCFARHGNRAGMLGAFYHFMDMEGRNAKGKDEIYGNKKCKSVHRTAGVPGGEYRH